jgi:hypothetical protein
MRLSVERYLDKFDPLSMITPRGVFCVNEGETDPNRVSLKQKTSSLPKIGRVTNTQKKKALQKCCFLNLQEQMCDCLSLSLVFCWNLKYCCDVCGSNFGRLHVIQMVDDLPFECAPVAIVDQIALFLNVSQPT